MVALWTGTLGHSVKLVQLTHAPVVVLQTRPAFAPTHPAVVQLKPGGGGGPGGGSGVAEATQEPNEQMAEGTPAIEHDVPFAFFLQRHRFLPPLDFGWHWRFLH